MNCPNCNAVLRSDTCSRCETNVPLFLKAVRISNALYNKGLSYAKESNLSAAVESLKRSLELHKKNIDARNLLGLVYYGMGRVGEALKEWVISVSYSNHENVAEAYLAAFQKNQRKMDRYAESLKAYNQALVFVRQKSEDMALIRLKRAIENSPDYIDAHNLLAFCYLIQNDKAKALLEVEKVLGLDIGNSIALNYYRELNQGKPFGGKQEVKPEIKTFTPSPYSSYNVSSKKNFTSSLPISEVICLLVGALCAFAVFYFSVMPAQIGDKDEKIVTLEAQLVSQEEKSTALLEQKTKDLDDLIAQNEEANKKVAAMTSELEMQGRIQQVNVASSYAQQDREEEALVLLTQIDMNGLPADVQEIANNIKATVTPKLEKKYYDEGNQHYNARRYAEGKASLDKALTFTTPTSGITDDVFYLLGRIAEVDGEKDLAKSYYENIINNFANSNQVNNAKTRLRQLTR